MPRPPTTIERGDFQTPGELCAELCDVLLRHGVPSPAVVLEPTCGTGGFLLAAARAFPQQDVRIIGADIDGGHLNEARRRVSEAGLAARVRLVRADFFKTDWREVVGPLSGPLLILGNPPWVTSDRMRRIGGSNLPERVNFKGLAGLDAVTGRGNFDVSEWVLLRLLDLFQGAPATVAMLCKTAVARRVLEHVAAAGLTWSCRGAWVVDARQHFGAAVAACFLVFDTSAGSSEGVCPVYTALDARGPDHVFGVRDGALVSDVTAYERWQDLAAEDRLRWRSGIKHDCARVMELVRTSEGLRNGLGEVADLEDEPLHPLVKSTDVARGRVGAPVRLLIVTQHHIGEDTGVLATTAPRTWAYLVRHREFLEARASSIYRGKPAFSVFGVGPYSFAPWKLVVSGLHAELAFALVGPRAGKPTVVDDTCYFLGFEREDLARAALALCASQPARELLGALMFRDAKRPVTRTVLDRLHLGRLAELALRGEVAISDDVTTSQLRGLAELAGRGGCGRAGRAGGSRPGPRARRRCRRPPGGR